jgi:hypothetical protein
MDLKKEVTKALIKVAHENPEEFKKLVEENGDILENPIIEFVAVELGILTDKDLDDLSRDGLLNIVCHLMDSCKECRDVLGSFFPDCFRYSSFIR